MVSYGDVILDNDVFMDAFDNQLDDILLDTGLVISLDDNDYHYEADFDN